MHLSKEEVWEKCDELGYMEYIKENSTSCWIGGVTKECGVCEACQSRNQSYVSYVERKRLKDKQKGDEENCENVSSGIFKIMGAT